MNTIQFALNLMTLCLLMILAVVVILMRAQKPRAVRFSWFIGKPELKNPNRKEKHMIEKSITNEQKIRLALAPITATGKPAQIDGKPRLSVVSGDSTFTENEDGSFYLVSSDSPGVTQFLIEADADLGEGIELISEIIQLTVAGAKAASLGLSIGEPEAK